MAGMSGDDVIRRHLKFEELLTDISTRLLAVTPDEVHTAIGQAIGKVRDFFKLDRSAFLKVEEDSARLMHPDHLSCAEAVEPVPRDRDRAYLFPWLFQRALAGETLAMTAGELPLEAITDRQTAQQFGVRSFLVVPLMLHGKTGFVIGGQSLRETVEWDTHLVDRMRLLGQTLINAISRCKAEEDLRQAEMRYRTVANFTYDWEYWEDPDGHLLYMSPSCERITGYTVDAFLENAGLLRAIVHADDIEAWKKHHSEAASEPRPDDLQFRIRRRDGQARWIEHCCRPVTDAAGEFLGFRVSNRDITRRKTAEIDLRSAFREIEELKERLEAENVYLRHEATRNGLDSETIGESDVIVQVLSVAGQVAKTDATVLIMGETGTGKELLARAIHRQSDRRDRAMVKVNCAALPAQLIESELFGREKGAYTGALSRQIGRFELADKSTIFLDEVSELSPELQVKLLRVLQEGEFERLGSNDTVKVDTRVIAATNIDLKDAIERGAFRSDLYFRLNVVPITVPPLRERAEDIPLLVWHFVKELGAKIGKSFDSIPRKTMQMLQAYDWPGNIRELRNVIEHSMILTPGPVLQVSALRVGESPPSDPTRLEEVERRHILRILDRAGWRVSGIGGAAEMLGLKPTTLEYRMKKLGIQRP